MKDRSFRVLIIDDDPAVRDYLESLISRQGYEVYSAAGGEEALQKLKESHPDLITLDVVCPGWMASRPCESSRSGCPRCPS